MTTRTLNNQDGIALGPILFIIAILAIIAAAIAAGSGSFTANSNTESAKAMAETIITSCDDYQRAVQIVTMQNGCDPTALDWTPNGGGYPTGVTTWNGGDWDVRQWHKPSWEWSVRSVRSARRGNDL